MGVSRPPPGGISFTSAVTRTPRGRHLLAQWLSGIAGEIADLKADLVRGLVFGL